MDIIISMFAVIVAAGCFIALMSSDWRDKQKRRFAKVKAGESKEPINK